jgi:hypothetical protein
MTIDDGVALVVTVACCGAIVAVLWPRPRPPEGPIPPRAMRRLLDRQRDEQAEHPGREA